VLATGLVSQAGRRSVVGMLAGAGMAGTVSFRAACRFFSAVRDIGALFLIAALAGSWYHARTEPSFEDMLTKLRRTLIAARFTAVRPGQPHPGLLRDYALACAAAAAVSAKRGSAR
jgi:hypothetical protein